jgi:hypothetical protein
MGRSPYLQPYSMPANADVPPNKPSIYNDEFTAQRPTSEVDPSFVALASKWTTWDVADLGAIAAINPRLQMLHLIGGGSEKAWLGVYESLPLPTADEPFISYALFARALNSFVNASGDFAEVYWGMLLGEDLSDDTLELYAIQSQIARVTATLSGRTEAALWPAYDAAAPTADGEMNCGWPATYLRAAVSSTFNGVDDYTTSIRLSASVDGLGFQEVARYSGLQVPMRHVALAQRSNPDAGQLHTLFDFVRLFEGESDISTTGRIQQIGSV